MTQQNSEHQILEHKWEKLRGEVGTRWPQLTAEELNMIHPHDGSGCQTVGQRFAIRSVRDARSEGDSEQIQ